MSFPFSNQLILVVRALLVVSALTIRSHEVYDLLLYLTFDGLCCLVVWEHPPNDQEVMGSNPSGVILKMVPAAFLSGAQH